jgi:regulator of sigma E protease
MGTDAMDLLFKIGSVVALLAGLIFVHELGHFMVAKLLHVKVLRFSIGFGAKLAGFTWGETEYRLSVLPLGGYVKMAGEDPAQPVPPEDVGRTFLEQPPWKRLAIALAGPGANLVFPFVVYLALGLAQNGTLVPGPVIGTVAPGSPAAVAGLLAGDRVEAVEGPGEAPRPVRYFSDLRELVAPRPGVSLAFSIRRGQERLQLQIAPAREEDVNPVETRPIGVIGVTPVFASALAAPAPGVVSPLEPLDLVTSVNGREVRHAGELEAALTAAGCAPVRLEVRRGAGKARTPVALDGVPTCAASGERAILPADPSVSAYVSRVDEGSPAAAAGLTRGAQLVSVNGKPIRAARDLNAVAREFAPGKPVAIGLADGRTVALVPVEEKFKDEVTREPRSRPVIGFHLEDRAGIDTRPLLADEVPLRRAPAEVARLAADQLTEVVRLTVLGIYKIATFQLSFKNVGGTLMLFQIASEAAEAGLKVFLFQMALISVNLGLMNLLPIPVLDGGHIVTAMVEGATRRRLSLRARELANWVGLALLLSLMVLAFANDVIRIWG